MDWTVPRREINRWLKGKKISPLYQEMFDVVWASENRSSTHKGTEDISLKTLP